MTSPAPSLRSSWKWGVCGLLLLATMINYMDRLTLNLMAKRVKAEYCNNNNDLYGNLETGFGLAFAYGSIFSGLIVDRVGVRLYYPLMVALWSAAGFATGFARNYEEFLLCRTALGFFEAANWPCALYTTQRILPADQRTMGNGILQSGTALGSIIMPQFLKPFVTEGHGFAPDKLMPFLPAGIESWRYPFMIVGAFGGVWIVLWLLVIRPGSIPISAQMSAPSHGTRFFSILADQRFWALAIVVCSINATWHFFRAWTPLFMQEQRGYSETFVLNFSTTYYVAADVGSILMGAIVIFLVRRKFSVHASRMATFGFCATLCLLSFAVAFLPRGWWFLGALTMVGFATLGLFPNYYSFTQELSAKHQGKVSGLLGCITWHVTAGMQKFVGWMTRAVEGQATPTDYTWHIAMAGLPPIIAFFALLLLWRTPRSAPLAPSIEPAKAPAAAP